MNNIIAARLRVQWALVLTGVFLGLCTACSPADPLDEARKMQAVGDFSGALESLRGVLARDPENSEALYLNGVSLNRIGETGMAQWSLLRAMDDPDWLEKAAFEAVSGSFAARNWTQSIELMNRVLEADPDNVEALQIRSHARIRLRNQYEEALVDVERVLELDPDNRDVLTDRAVALIGLDRFEEAEDAIASLESTFRESSPSEDMTAHFCVTNAMFSAEAGRLEEAEKLYEGCFEEFEDAEIAFSGLLGFYDFIERKDRAFDLLEELVGENPSANLYRYELVKRLEDAERFDEAEQLMRDALELEDESSTAGVWFQLGRHYMARGDYDSAADAAKKGLDQTPQPGSDLLSYYAEALLNAERFEEALAVADEMTVPPYQALVRAVVAFKRQQPEVALEYFEASQRFWPENPVSRYYAARSAEQIGDFDRAIAEYRYALRSAPAKTDAGLRLARIFRAQGEDDEANHVLVHVIQEAENQGPAREPEMDLLRIEILGALGRGRPLAKVLTEVVQNESPEGIARAVSRAAGGAAQGFGAEEGLKLLTRWVELEFTAVANALALEKRVELEARAGRAEEAVKLAKAAAEAHPNEAVFREILASAQSRNGASTEVALAGYRKALELDPSRTQSMLALARHDADSGNPAAALARLEDFVEQNPGAPPPEVVRQRSEWLTAVGRGKETRQLLEGLLREDPTDAAAARALARWHLENVGGDGETAKRYALQAKRFGGDDAPQELVD